MSFKSYVSAAVAATLALSSLSSFAQVVERRGNVVIVQQQPDHSRYDHRDQRNDRRYDDRRNDRQVQIGSDRRYDRNDRYDRHDNRRWQNQRPVEVHNNYYYGARGPQFVRGHRLPNELRVRQYVVNDYRGHHLPAPSYGHQWVQVGGDYVLAAIATGIIASVILSR